jgi:hypothetical protein
VLINVEGEATGIDTEELNQLKQAERIINGLGYLRERGRAQFSQREAGTRGLAPISCFSFGRKQKRIRGCGVTDSCRRDASAFIRGGKLTKELGGDTPTDPNRTILQTAVGDRDNLSLLIEDRSPRMSGEEMPLDAVYLKIETGRAAGESLGNRIRHDAA